MKHHSCTKRLHRLQLSTFYRTKLDLPPWSHPPPALSTAVHGTGRLCCCQCSTSSSVLTFREVRRSKDVKSSYKETNIRLARIIHDKTEFDNIWHKWAELEVLNPFGWLGPLLVTLCPTEYCMCTCRFIHSCQLPFLTLRVGHSHASTERNQWSKWNHIAIWSLEKTLCIQFLLND